MERVHQVSLNKFITKDLDNKVFDYVDPWGETLASIAWAIRDYYYRNIEAISIQSVFRRNMISKIASVVYWRVITAKKKRQVDIDNVQENSRRVAHYYAVENIVHLKMTGI